MNQGNDLPTSPDANPSEQRRAIRYIAAKNAQLAIMAQFPDLFAAAPTQPAQGEGRNPQNV